MFEQLDPGGMPSRSSSKTKILMQIDETINPKAKNERMQTGNKVIVI